MTSIWEYLAAAGAGFLDLESFEQWVYENSELETILGPRSSLDLISFDFTQPHPRHALASLIEKIFSSEQRDANEDLACYLARGYLSGNIDLLVIARQFAAFWTDGFTWAPSEFAYIDSELDDVPFPSQYALWDANALARRKVDAAPGLRAFEDAARSAAETVLTTIEEQRRSRSRR